MTYASEVLADAPAAYWRLGESSGTNAVDISGNNRDGTYANAPTLGVAGALTDSDTAVTLNGTDERVDCPSFSQGTTFSVEAWFKGTTTSRAIVSRWFGTSTDRFWFVDNGGASGRIRFQVGNTGGSFFTATSTNAFSDDAWHHMVAVCDAGALTLYIDGASEGTGTVTGTVRSGSVVVTIGARRDGSGAGAHANFWAGSVDEVAIYDTALSGTRVADHFAAASVFFGTGVGAYTFTGTADGDVTVVVEGTGAGAYTFTGAGTGVATGLETGTATGAYTFGGTSSALSQTPGAGYAFAVAIYDEDNATPIATLPAVFDAEIFEVRNLMNGWCRLRTPANAPGASSLQWRRVLRIAPTWTTRVYVYVIQAVTELLAPDGTFYYEVTGTELGAAWLSNAIVHGEYGGANLDRRTGRERPFNFASREGAWRVTGDWITVTEQTTWAAQSPKHPAADQWFSGGSYWIRRTPDPGTGGTCYFRCVYTLPGSDPLPVTIHFATDDTTQFWLDGTKRGQFDGVDKLDSENERQEHQEILVPGEHTFAFMIRDDVQWTGEGAQGELLLAMWEVNEAGDRVGSPLLISDETWIAANAPVGHTAGNVLKRLVDEARDDRDVLGLSNLALGFDDDEDSNAVEWAQRREIQLPVLSALTDTQVIPRLCVEYGVDCWVDGPTNTLHLAQRRGGTSATVLGLGVNVTDWQCRPHPLDASWLAVDSEEGWATVTNGALETSLGGRIESAFSAGGSPSVLAAEDAADVELALRGVPTYDVTVEYAMGPGSEPGGDFDLDDDVTVPGPGRVPGPARVMAYRVQVRPDRTVCTVQVEWEEA